MTENPAPATDPTPGNMMRAFAEKLDEEGVELDRLVVQFATGRHAVARAYPADGGDYIGIAVALD